MSADIVSLDAERASRYIGQALHGFMIDPAETEYQRGYLSALLTIYREGLGKGAGDDRLVLLDKQAEAR